MDRIYEGHSSLRHPFSFIGSTKNHQACSLGGKHSQSYTKPCSAQPPENELDQRPAKKVGYVQKLIYILLEAKLEIQ